MRGFVLTFFVIPIAILGSIVIPSPWMLETGEVSIALGNPTLGIRYGVVDFAEVGVGLREKGVYFKLGYSNEAFGINAGISTYTFESAALFGSLGVKSGNLELSAGGFYFEEYSFYASSTSHYSLSAEIFLQTEDTGNMESGLGIFGSYEFQDKHLEGGVYASSVFKNVWFLDRVDLMGGVSVHHRLGEDFQILRSIDVIFNLSTSFYLFKK